LASRSKASLPPMLPFAPVDFADVHTINIILNYHNLTLLVLTRNLTKVEETILNDYKEYGFIQLCSHRTKNQNICNQIKHLFSDIGTVTTADMINKYLEMAAKYVSLFGNDVDSVTTNILSEERHVTNFIQENYIIDHSIEHRIRASILYKTCFGLMRQSDHLAKSDSNATAIRNLSKYLKNMGLQKKRYNDGFYYYGIREKTKDELKSDVKTVDTTYRPDV
jgi:hypothetical protein